MKLGILEFGNHLGQCGSGILENVIEYAKCADQYGFSRFWLTEHHTSNIGWSNPEMMLPVLAANTKWIKIGIAGTLASVHSPYRLACNFKLLSTLYPDRIDLGFANGRPSMQTTKYLTNRKYVTNKIYAAFNGHVRLICDFLRSAEAHSISPISDSLPEMWLLGSSNKHLSFAREMKIGYSKSLFHTNHPVSQDIDMIFQHRELYISEHHTIAPLNIAFSGLCDSDSQKAKKRFYEMHKFEYDPKTNIIVGSPAYFSDRLSALQEKTGIDEFIFKDIDVNNMKRLKTLSQLSNVLISKENV